MIRVVLPLALLVSSITPASASTALAATIRSMLETWRDDFNARRADHICDLFAHDLRYDVQGLPEQNYTQLCQRLHKALSDQSKAYHYDLQIKEILVSGDLAIVRLTWTETTTGKETRTEVQPGLDVFGRQSDGGWKIIRYMSYVATD